VAAVVVVATMLAQVKTATVVQAAKVSSSSDSRSATHTQQL
jgi:hypothetical protein